VNFEFVITKKGTKPIYNVRIDAQSVYKKLGTIKPGKSKMLLSPLKYIIVLMVDRECTILTINVRYTTLSLKLSI
jgi:hypothetical protein